MDRSDGVAGLSRSREPWLRRHAANAVTLTALIPLVVVLRPGGLAYLPLALWAVDAIDSLDGVVARALGTSSAFGQQLDRTCDALAHGLLVALVAAQLPGWWALAGIPTLMAMATRLTRQSMGGDKKTGASTNELLRHLYLALLLISSGIPAIPLLPALLLLHTLTLTWQRPMRYLLRRHARTPARLALFYGALALPWLVPATALPLALLFFLTWMASLLAALGRPA